MRSCCGSATRPRDELPLNAGSIAALHSRLIAMLDRNELPSHFNGRPSEIEGAVPFAEDKAPRALRPQFRRPAARGAGGDAAGVRAFPRRLHRQGQPGAFLVGRFDLAVTRFSGRDAPPHPGGIPGLPDRITREAYSQEVSSAGFWAGGVVARPSRSSTATPIPSRTGFRDSGDLPVGALRRDLGEFILPYAEVRAASDPAADAERVPAIDLRRRRRPCQWDRAALEREPVAP